MMYLILFLIGACIGSFINVIFTRRDWYKGRSRCDSCGYVLKWYDLIPVISFLLLRGRCRKCKSQIDASHFISEIFMGAAFVIGYICLKKLKIEYGILSAVSLFFMAVYAIEDNKEKMIYSWLLNAGIIVVGAIKLNIMYSENELFPLLITLITAVIFKLVFALVSFAGIGNGDFDIMLIIYFLFGDYGTGFCISISAFMGCAIYLPAVLLKKYDRKLPLAFAPLLFMGTMLCLVI